MKVVLVARYGSIRGGAETYVATLAAGLREAGHGVALAYGREPDRSRPEVAGGLELPGLLEPTDPGLLATSLAALRPDVVHCALPEHPWVVDACTRTGPTVLSVQDHKLHCPTGTKYWAAWKRACTVNPGPWCLGYNLVAHCGSLKANATLHPYRAWSSSSKMVRERDLGVQVFSDAVADLLEPVIGRRPVVTPYATPPRSDVVERDQSSAPELPVAPSGPASDPRPVIVAIGRLNREKGFRELLDVVTAIGVRCHLVVIGEGHDRPALERRAKRASGGHRVTFTGWLDERERDRWLRRAKVVVVPSMWPEPFGIVGLEAMAASVPVVAFRSGGIGTWLVHDETGLLVEPGDLRGLAISITSLLRDPARARALGAAGQVRARERFALADHVRDVLALYHAAGAR